MLIARRPSHPRRLRRRSGPAAKKPKGSGGRGEAPLRVPTEAPGASARERSRSSPALRSSLTVRPSTLTPGREEYPAIRFDQSGTWALTHSATRGAEQTHKSVRISHPSARPSSSIEGEADPFARPDSDWLGGPYPYQIDIHERTRVYRLDTPEGSQGSQSSGATPPPEDGDGDEPPDLDFDCDLLGRSAPPTEGESVPEGEEPPEEEDEEEPEEEEPAFDVITSDGPGTPPPGGAGGLAAASSAVGNAPNLQDRPWAIQGWGGPEDPDINWLEGLQRAGFFRKTRPGTLVSAFFESGERVKFAYYPDVDVGATAPDCGRLQSLALQYGRSGRRYDFRHVSHPEDCEFGDSQEEELPERGGVLKAPPPQYIGLLTPAASRPAPPKVPPKVPAPPAATEKAGLPVFPSAEDVRAAREAASQAVPQQAAGGPSPPTPPGGPTPPSSARESGADRVPSEINSSEADIYEQVNRLARRELEEQREREDAQVRERREREERQHSLRHLNRLAKNRGEGFSYTLIDGQIAKVSASGLPWKSPPIPKPPLSSAAGSTDVVGTTSTTTPPRPKRPAPKPQSILGHAGEDRYEPPCIYHNGSCLPSNLLTIQKIKVVLD